METPLNAREFLQRFHLPQLVRLSSASGEQLDQKDEDSISNRNELAAINQASLEQCQQVSGSSVRVISPNRSNTSISSSFVVADSSKQSQHEKSNWTYRAVSSMPTKQLLSLGGRSEQNLNKSIDDDDDNVDNDDDDNKDYRLQRGFRSFQMERDGRNRQQVVDVEDLINDGKNDIPERRFRSISDWSTIHQHATMRQESDVDEKRNQLANRNNMKKSVEFQQKVSQKDGQSSKWCDALQSIRLTPPSKRPALSKLQLNQPFLLYKAYKKLELCTYVIDLKNEVNEKSGDPIYFPQNYPGWFSMAQATNNKDKINRAKPLESIDEVCRTSGAQIFLTRDEIIAYQLPTKLSHLTKLKNNQLLALPLAINLNKALKSSNESSTKDLGRHQDQTSSNNISDIRQIVVQCGQVMKICGVYEDVLPLMESRNNAEIVHGINGCKNETKQHHTRRSMHINPSSYEHHHHQQQQKSANLYRQMASQPLASAIHRHQMAAAAAASQWSSQSICHHNQSDFQQLNKAIQSDSSKQRRTLKSLKLRYAQNQSVLAENNASYNQTSPFIFDHYSQSGLKVINPISQVKQQQQQQQLVKLRGRQQERSQQLVGQRYARCILLNQKSIDKITNCSSSVNTKQSDNSSNDDNDESDESEVLIPIDQRGRFYLCATNQSIVTQLYCHGCNSSSIQPSLVFRLSQIVSLINLSRRLALKNKQIIQQQQQQNNISKFPYRQERTIITNDLLEQPVVKLPILVQLVIGPRPANFSPTMFGSSSTMESYFRIEANVGGHSIQCNYNRQFDSVNNGQKSHHYKQHRLNSDMFQNLNESICGCAQKLSKTSVESSGEYYGIFSAVLRIEKIVKRDVLLACTIKRDPLIHLDLFSSENSQQSATTTSSSEMDSNSSNSRDRKKNRNSSATMATAGDNKSQFGFLSSSLALDKLNKSNKLISLRESTSNIVQSRDNNSTTTTSTKLDLKSIGKSSFSRLRACRSLISLNGKRKKRPNIPTSMLMVSPGLNYDCSAPGGVANNHTSSSSYCSFSYTNSYEHAESRRQSLSLDHHHQHGQNNNNTTASIVLLEFDCNNEELRFTRTFVESSIPTSTIPDLVLKRMEYCYKNSQDWERQLKLSHLTLRQDYDSCQLQMRQNRRAKLVENQQIHLSSSQNNNSLIRNQTACNTASSLSSSLAAFHVSDSTTGSGLGSGSGSGSSSSSSSRSSSGVSSSVAVGDCATIMNSQKIHKKLMRNNEESGGGLARHLEAEKAGIHMRAGGGSIGRLMLNQQKLSSGQFNTLFGDISSQKGEHQQEESEDSGSHLYESLERLNENRHHLQQQEVRYLNKQQIKAAAAVSTSSSNALMVNNKRNDQSRSGNSSNVSARSRSKMGKSIDFLVNCKSSRMSALVIGRKGKSYNSNDFGDEEDDDREEEEDDEDDDWWQRSTYNTREQQQKPQKPQKPQKQLQYQQQVVNSRETREQHSKNVVELADNWSSGVQTNRMEPVSIEACNDEFVSVVDDEVRVDADADADDYDNDNVQRQGQSDERTSIEACSEISSYQSSSGFCYTCSSIK